MSYFIRIYHVSSELTIVASMTEGVCNTLQPDYNSNSTIRRKTNSRSVKSQTGQLAETFDLKLAVNNRYQCN